MKVLTLSEWAREFFEPFLFLTLARFAGGSKTALAEKTGGSIIDVSLVNEGM